MSVSAGSALEHVGQSGDGADHGAGKRPAGITTAVQDKAMTETVSGLEMDRQGFSAPGSYHPSASVTPSVLHAPTPPSRPATPINALPTSGSAPDAPVQASADEATLPAFRKYGFHSEGVQAFIQAISTTFQVPPSIPVTDRLALVVNTALTFCAGICTAEPTLQPHEVSSVAAFMVSTRSFDIPRALHEYRLVQATLRDSPLQEVTPPASAQGRAPTQPSVPPQQAYQQYQPAPPAQSRQPHSAMERNHLPSHQEQQQMHAQARQLEQAQQATVQQRLQTSQRRESASAQSNIHQHQMQAPTTPTGGYHWHPQQGWQPVVSGAQQPQSQAQRPPQPLPPQGPMPRPTQSYAYRPRPPQPRPPQTAMPSPAANQAQTQAKTPQSPSPNTQQPSGTVAKPRPIAPRATSESRKQASPIRIDTPSSLRPPPSMARKDSQPVVHSAAPGSTAQQSAASDLKSSPNGEALANNQPATSPRPPAGPNSVPASPTHAPVDDIEAVLTSLQNEQSAIHTNVSKQMEQTWNLLFEPSKKVVHDLSQLVRIKDARVKELDARVKELEDARPAGDQAEVAKLRGLLVKRTERMTAVEEDKQQEIRKMEAERAAEKAQLLKKQEALDIELRTTKQRLNAEIMSTLDGKLAAAKEEARVAAEAKLLHKVVKAEAKVDELEEQLDEERSKTHNLRLALQRVERAQAGGDVEGVQKALEAKIAEGKIALDDAHKALEAKIAESTTAIDAANQNSARLQARLAEAEQAKTDAEKALEAKIAEGKAALDGMHKALEAQIAESKTALDAANQNSLRLEARLAEAEQAKADSEKALEAKIARGKTALDGMHKALEAKMAESKTALDAANQTPVRLQARLAEAEQAKTDAEVVSASYKTNHQAAVERLKMLLGALADLRREMGVADPLIEELGPETLGLVTQDVGAATARLSTLAKAQADNQKLIEELWTQRDAEQEQVAKHAVSIKNLEQKAGELANEAARVKADRHGLKKQLDEVTTAWQSAVKALDEKEDDEVADLVGITPSPVKTSVPLPEAAQTPTDIGVAQGQGQPGSSSDQRGGPIDEPKARPTVAEPKTPSTPRASTPVVDLSPRNRSAVKAQTEVGKHSSVPDGSASLTAPSAQIAPAPKSKPAIPAGMLRPAGTWATSPPLGVKPTPANNPARTLTHASTSAQTLNNGLSAETSHTGTAPLPNQADQADRIARPAAHTSQAATVKTTGGPAKTDNTDNFPTATMSTGAGSVGTSESTKIPSDASTAGLNDDKHTSAERIPLCPASGSGPTDTKAQSNASGDGEPAMKGKGKGKEAANIRPSFDGSQERQRIPTSMEAPPASQKRSRGEASSNSDDARRKAKRSRREDVDSVQSMGTESQVIVLEDSDDDATPTRQSLKPRPKPDAGKSSTQPVNPSKNASAPSNDSPQVKSETAAAEAKPRNSAGAPSTSRHPSLSAAGPSSARAHASSGSGSSRHSMPGPATQPSVQRVRENGNPRRSSMPGMVRDGTPASATSSTQSPRRSNPVSRQWVIDNKKKFQKPHVSGWGVVCALCFLQLSKEVRAEKYGNLAVNFEPLPGSLSEDELIDHFLTHPAMLEQYRDKRQREEREGKVPATQSRQTVVHRGSCRSCVYNN